MQAVEPLEDDDGGDTYYFSRPLAPSTHDIVVALNKRKEQEAQRQAELLEEQKREQKLFDELIAAQTASVEPCFQAPRPTGQYEGNTLLSEPSDPSVASDEEGPAGGGLVLPVLQSLMALKRAPTRATSKPGVTSKAKPQQAQPQPRPPPGSLQAQPSFTEGGSIRGGILRGGLATPTVTRRVAPGGISDSFSAANPAAGRPTGAASPAPQPPPSSPAPGSQPSRRTTRKVNVNAPEASSSAAIAPGTAPGRPPASVPRVPGPSWAGTEHMPHNMALSRSFTFGHKHAAGVIIGPPGAPGAPVPSAAGGVVVAAATPLRTPAGATAAAGAPVVAIHDNSDGEVDSGEAHALAVINSSGVAAAAAAAAAAAQPAPKRSAAKPPPPPSHYYHDDQDNGGTDSDSDGDDDDDNSPAESKATWRRARRITQSFDMAGLGLQGGMVSAGQTALGAPTLPTAAAAPALAAASASASDSRLHSVHSAPAGGQGQASPRPGSPLSPMATRRGGADAGAAAATVTAGPWPPVASPGSSHLHLPMWLDKALGRGGGGQEGGGGGDRKAGGTTSAPTSSVAAGGRSNKGAGFASRLLGFKSRLQVSVSTSSDGRTAIPGFDAASPSAAATTTPTSAPSALAASAGTAFTAALAATGGHPAGGARPLFAGISNDGRGTLVIGPAGPSTGAAAAAAALTDAMPDPRSHSLRPTGRGPLESSAAAASRTQDVSNLGIPPPLQLPPQHAQQAPQQLVLPAAAVSPRVPSRTSLEARPPQGVTSRGRFSLDSKVPHDGGTSATATVAAAATHVQQLQPAPPFGSPQSSSSQLAMMVTNSFDRRRGDSAAVWSMMVTPPGLLPPVRNS